MGKARRQCPCTSSRAAFLLAQQLLFGFSILNWAGLGASGRGEGLSKANGRVGEGWELWTQGGQLTVRLTVWVQVAPSSQVRLNARPLTGRPRLQENS